MRILKLVVWDLDETILTGILEEGDEDINPVASKMMGQLDEQGVLQALATQNPPEIIPSAIEKFGWSDLFIQVESDLGPKVKKVRRILDALGVNPLDVAFVDEDPFERDSIAAQISGVSTWSITDLESYLRGDSLLVTTEEGRRRPQMYREQQARTRDEDAAGDYNDFLRACDIRLTIRPYCSADAERTEELLTRTHRMNLGVLPVDEAIRRLNQSSHNVVVAEMKDIYGDMGRCGIMHLAPQKNGEALIESLAISCRTRARGLSLAMLVGLLRHSDAQFEQYRCRYVFNGSNRPLRMLLMGAGFKPNPGTDELALGADKLAKMELPDWVHIGYEPH